MRPLHKPQQPKLRKHHHRVRIVRFVKRFFLYSAFGTAALGTMEYLSHRSLAPASFARSIENLLGSAGAAAAEEVLAAVDKAAD